MDWQKKKESIKLLTVVDNQFLNNKNNYNNNNNTVNKLGYIKFMKYSYIYIYIGCPFI